MTNSNARSVSPVDSSRFTPREQARFFFRILPNAIPIWDKLLLRIMITLITAFLGIIYPIMTKRIIDEVFPQRDFALLVQCVLIILVTHTLVHSFYLVHDALMHYGQHKIALNMKTGFYRHLQRLSVRFFFTRPIGEHMFRCTRDVNDASILVNGIIPSVAATLQRLLATTFLLNMMGLEWLILPVIVYLMMYFMLRHWMSTKIRSWDRRERGASQRVEAVTREILSAFKLVQGYNRPRTVRRWYASRLVDSVRAGFRRNIYLHVDIFLQLPGSVLPLFITGLGFATGVMVIKGDMTIGEYAVVGTVVQQLIFPIQTMITNFQSIRQKLVPAERMFETLDVLPEIENPADGRRLPELEGRVEVRSVRFSYDEEPVVLDDVSIVANPGEKVAIVGVTGAGKTTLTNLLVRLYDPVEGAILVDGVNVRDVTQSSLRRRIGIVMQDNYVFADTLRENVRYGLPGASDEQVMRAGKISHVHEFAVTLPQEYGTFLGEGGALSGGQKQRISLARAIVRDPQILIMDEATSALDPILEKSVAAALDEALKGKTRIVVAQNLITIRNADRIYVLDKGRIVEQGTHDDLMNAGGLYYKMWAEEQDRTEGGLR